MKSPPLIVALGVCHRDTELATLWLRWVHFLSTIQCNGENVLLVVHSKSAREFGERERQRQELYANPYHEFTVHVEECRDECEDGYPKSASHLFLRTLETAEQLYPDSAVLWCEPDTVPMKPSWFFEIAAEYAACGKPFIGAKVGTQYPHLSGNAVYPHNWRKLAPSIAKVLDAPDYRLWGQGKGQPWDVYCRHETTPQMAVSKRWHSVWKDRDPRPTLLKDIPAETSIFHQDKTGGLIREIAALRYPEFMAALNDTRRFFVMNGHPTRLRTKGIAVDFSFSKHSVTGWTSAVCTDELKAPQASAMATLVGQLGVREVQEAEFLKITGRHAKSLAGPRVRSVAPIAPIASRHSDPVSHPSVFVMLGRYGDICNVLPMLKAEAAAGHRPTLVVSKDFADILDGVSYVDRIVWDGPYDRLPDALRWLRKDKGIQSPVVCQYHTNPYDKGRLTDSYQKEVWRLAGRLKDFETRGPLIFDRRDAERESALCKRFPNGQELPIVLVGMESISSPLQNADEIMRALLATETIRVIDLKSVYAERIYDLIGLYERAACIVTADTVHLHLARATKTPVVALRNNGWRGSVIHEGVRALPYSEVTPEKVGYMIEDALKPRNRDTLTSFTWPRVGLTPQEVEEMAKTEIVVREVSLNQVDMIVTPRVMREVFGKQATIFHIVDIYGSSDRHHVAQSTWQAAYAEGIVPVHVSGYPRTAKSEFNDPRALPFLKDILQVGINESSCDDDVILWTNSDIGLKPGTAEFVRKHVRQYGVGSMRRTESNGEHHMGRDLFAFSVRWLKAHWDEMPDYVLGVPIFDLGLAAIIRLHAGIKTPLNTKNVGEDMPPADMAPGYALHQSHTSEWLVRNHHVLPATSHNREEFFKWAKRHAPEIKFSKGRNLI